MQFLRHLKIGQRLGLGFAALVATAVVVAGIGITRLSAIADELVAIKDSHVPNVQQVAVVADNLNQAAQVLRNALIFDDPAKAQFATLMAAGNKAGATTLLVQKMRPDQLAFKKALDTLYDAQLAHITQTATDGQASDQRARNVMLGLLGLTAGLALCMAWVSARSVTEPLNRAVAIAERVAAGDLGADIEIKTSNEIGALFAALKKMNHNLARMVGEVRSGADAIATSSAQISTGNADLSQRTEVQAGNLQQTSASMDALALIIKQNADTARQANLVATSAGEAAAKGGVVVGAVVGTMRDIAESSHKIADIVSVIDSIAFQTNILALNAAVEAARAGEQGRGFAVVASEVRSLAQRSASAAKEIKALINSSTAKVESGSRQVDAAGSSMDDIVGQVKQVCSLITAIGAASVDQAQGIQQASQAVQRLDLVTQQNAALVEQSAAAAESLQAQAGQLVGTVSMFTVGTQALAG